MDIDRVGYEGRRIVGGGRIWGEIGDAEAEDGDADFEAKKF